MKLFHYISLAWSAIIMMALSLTACSGEDRFAPVPDGEDGGRSFRMSFDITLPVFPGTGSRASYEEGVGDYENTIDLSDFRILLFSQGNNPTLICNFDPQDVTIMPYDEKPTYRSYRVWAKVAEEITTYSNFKLVMLANWGSYPSLNIGSATLAEIDSHTFNAADKFVAQNGSHIPMYGVKDCNNVVWQDLTLTWLNNLWMLRAVAKIEVQPADDSAGISNVRLVRYNEKGTCAPNDIFTETEYVNGQNNYTGDIALNLPKGINDPDAKVYDLQADENGIFVAYVPEYKNISSDNPNQLSGPQADDCAYLEVSYDYGATFFRVDFKYYSDKVAENNGGRVGEYFDIKRNFYYRYTVSRDWEVQLALVPFGEVDLKPDFGFDTSDYIPQIDKETGWFLIYNESAQLISIYNDEYDQLYKCEAYTPDPENLPTDVQVALYKVYYDPPTQEKQYLVGYYELYAASFFDQKGRNISVTPNGWHIISDEYGIISELYCPFHGETYSAIHEHNKELGWVGLLTQDENAKFIAYYDTKGRQFFDFYETPIWYDYLLGYQCYKDENGDVWIMYDPLEGIWYMYDDEGNPAPVDYEYDEKGNIVPKKPGNL